MIQPYTYVLINFLTIIICLIVVSNLTSNFLPS